MTSSNGNIFRVTGHLCGEFTGPRWIPHTKASDAELWCFLWSASDWVNNREAGDLRRYCAHYDVIVMDTIIFTPSITASRLHGVWWPLLTVASFTKEVEQRLAKRPLVFNGRLANRGLTSFLVKEATEVLPLSEKLPLMNSYTMMTSSNGNIFRVTDHLCGDSPVPG